MLAAELGEAHGNALGLVCDVTREGDLERSVNATRVAFGRIDIVVANAGFAVRGRLDTLALADYRRQFETNVMGVLRTVVAGLEELKRTRGCLVLMGSVGSYLALPEDSAYAMSKFAVRALAGALRDELAAYQIGVSLVCPGFVESEIYEIDNQGVRQPGTPRRVPPRSGHAHEPGCASDRRRRGAPAPRNRRHQAWPAGRSPAAACPAPRRVGGTPGVHVVHAAATCAPLI